MPGDGGGSNGRVMFWVNRMVGVACGAVLAVAAWKGLRGMEFRSLFRLPVTPVLGEAGYAMRMVGTIEELIEREELRGKRMAVWGGTLARAHDLPFRWRVTADWFLLPAKGVPIVPTVEEAVGYEYILSPWHLGKRLEGPGRRVELVADETRVWLYRISPEEELEE